MIHAIAVMQEAVDGSSGKLWCDDCGAALNITPVSWCFQSTFTELNGKFTGMAFCVPTPNVSVVDLTGCLIKAAKLNDVKKVVKQTQKAH